MSATLPTHNPHRLLFLAPFAPRLDAAHGGARAVAQMIAALSEQHQTALLCLRLGDEPPVDAELRRRCAIVEEVRRPNGAMSLLRGSRLASMASGWPMWATFSAVGEYAARLRAIARNWQPDVVQAEFHVMGQYLSTLVDCAAARVLTIHEPGFAAARDRMSSERGLDRFSDYFEMRAWMRYERRIARAAEAIVVLTERDRASLEELRVSTPVVRIPLGVPVAPRALDPCGAEPPGVLFVGSFKHQPNVDAAARLAERIFPRVRAEVANATLTLVGARAPRHLERMAGEGVVVAGRVPDVTPYLDAAAVVAIPLRHGGGMRVKVLEALAAGKAVVATRLAAEGLALDDGEQIVFAETDEEIARAIAALLADPERRCAIAARARTWARENLGWERSVAAYERLYDGLVARRGNEGRI